ncbi:MAG: hypothetical protein JW888_15510, partial [Pirellulales bacterium]|nr:hypothetical protein [Pirellulales bacterium]
MVGTLMMVGSLLVVGQQSLPTTDLTPEVRRLTRQLDAPQLERRNAAEAELIGLGPRILSLLPSPETRLSAEVEQRLARVRQKLEQQLAAAAVEASHVTLNNPHIKLSRLLIQIERQTGNRVIDARRQFGQQPSDPELAVDFDKTPFWKAVDRVLEQTGLTVYPFGPDRAV